MSPDDRHFFDNHYPDHHLSFDERKNIWKVFAYNTSHRFPSTKYRGPEKAKAAAVAFRNQIPSEGLSWDSKSLHRATTGVFRVNRQGCPVWCAEWPEKNSENTTVYRKKTFAVNKYGEQVAHDMALNFYRSRLARIH